MERFLSARGLTLPVIPLVLMGEAPGRSATSFASSIETGI
jgi:hypothetical protein